MDVDLPKALKRCLSAPIINNLATTSSQAVNKTENFVGVMSSTAVTQASNSPSREASQAPVMNIFAPRARRYSASFASLGAGNINAGPCLTPRVSQLRQEECIDINSREVNHEREVHSAMQISQSWEDLTLVAENWSCKSDDLTNPLQVTLPSGASSCSSPSPTSRTGMRLPYGLSPSPTRRTFATRRSMSPIAMRPSQLGPVKRKFELEDNSNTYSPPPLKKIFTESRGSSPICQSPSSICPSPDSGTCEGRTTPKLFISKLYTTNTNSSSSLCSSPMVPSPVTDAGIDLQSNNSSSPANTISSSSNDPLSITSCDTDIDLTLTNKQDDTKVLEDTLMEEDKLSDDSDKNQNTDKVFQNQPKEEKLLSDKTLNLTEINTNIMGSKFNDNKINEISKNDINTSISILSEQSSQINDGDVKIV